MNNFNFFSDAFCGLLKGQIDDGFLGVCAEAKGGEVLEDVLEAASTSAKILRKFSENILEKFFGIKMSLDYEKYGNKN